MSIPKDRVGLLEELLATCERRDEARRMADILYRALKANREAWRTTNVSNGATRNAQAITDHAIRIYETEEG